MQLRRRSAASPLTRRYSASTSPGGDRWSGSDVIPCLANAPTPWLTWQRPQIPRPPQTESMSTPSERAASRTVVPSGNRPRRPDGVKITSASAGSLIGRRLSPRPATRRRPAAAAPVDPAALLALGRGLAERPDPAAALRVVAHQHVGGHDRVPDALRDRVRDRRGQPARDRHRQERPVDPLAVRQPEADVRGAAGAVDLELVAQPAEDPEDLPAGRRHRPDRHEQRVDDRRPRAGCRGPRRARRSAWRPRTGRRDPRRCRSRRSRSRRPRRRTSGPAAGPARGARPRRSPS